MLHWIFTNFRACTSPKCYLARATTSNSSKSLSEKKEQRVVFPGASNLKHVATISDHVFSQVDISTLGWTPTPDNISRIADMVKQKIIEGATAFVFDLF
jgi:hypothetical protein